MEDVLKLIVGLRGINTYIIIAVLLMYKLNPITLISSVGIERKLQSKEINYLYNIVICILLSFASSFVISIVLLILVNTVTVELKLIYYLAIFIGMTMYLYITSKDSSQSDDLISFKNRIDKLFKKSHYFLSVYIGVWTIIVIYAVIELCNIETISNKSLMYQYYSLLALSFILILAVSIIAIWPLVKILKNLNPVNYYINMGENKWYILYIIKKNEILLGEKYKSSECNKYKIINRQELEKREIFKEKSKLYDESIIVSNKQKQVQG